MGKFIFKDDEDCYMVIEWVHYIDFKKAYRDLEYDYQHGDRDWSDFYYELTNILKVKNPKINIIQSVIFTHNNFIV